jgi:hypothetical protein
MAELPGFSKKMNLGKEESANPQLHLTLLGGHCFILSPEIGKFTCKVKKIDK